MHFSFKFVVMEDASRSHVTITLGRSGQVVKRSGTLVDSDFLDPVLAKRSLKDRLGSNVDSVHRDSKRQHGVNGRLSAKASNDVDDTHLSKHDLRFKIMKKIQKNSKQKNVDLRDMLSRKAHSSSTNQKMHQSPPEPRNSRQRAHQLTPEQNDDKRCTRVPKDGQWDPIEVGPRDDRRIVWDPVEVRPPDDRQIMRDPVEVGPRDDRRLMRVPAEVGPHMHKLYDNRQPNLDPIVGSMPSRLISTRTSRTLSQMDLSKTSFSLEMLDHISRPSPHNVLGNSAGLPPPPPPRPPPSTQEPLRRPLMKPFNDPRPVSCTSRDILEIPRPMASSFPIKPAISNGPTKPMGPLVAPQLPTGGIVQQCPYPVEYLTLEGFLHSLGLDKYTISFKVEEVDMATLSQMGDHDLKEMGIPMVQRGTHLSPNPDRTKEKDSSGSPCSQQAASTLRPISENGHRPWWRVLFDTHLLFSSSTVIDHYN